MPKPFQLQAVLGYRKLQENQAKDRLARATADLRAQERELARRREALAAAYRDRDRALETNPGLLALYDHHIQWLKEEIRSQESRRDEAARTVERRRRMLLLAAQERRALERLEERQNDAYRRYLRKQENLVLDEIAVLRHQG